MDIKFLIALLPAVFMIHDFEEIIMSSPWLDKNRDEVKRRFPRAGDILQTNHNHLSMSGYAIAVLHEFLIVAFITYASLYFESYHWWFGLFAAFSVHLVAHIAQWIIYGKYIPVILTSILALPYCIYTFAEFTKVTDMTVGQLWLWTIIGLALTIASFPPAFFLASRFENWKNRKYLQKAD
jgi:hypothetical protein